MGHKYIFIKDAVFFLLLVVIFAFVPPANSDTITNKEWQFIVKQPKGWVNNRSSLGNDLVLQLFEPKQDAFIEVYAVRGKNPGLKILADGWEKLMKDKKLPYVTRTIAGEDLMIGKVPAILRNYDGKYQGKKIASYVLFCHHQGIAYIVLGVFIPKYEDMVFESVAGFKFTSDKNAKVDLARNIKGPATIKNVRPGSGEGDGARNAKNWQWVYQPKFAYWIKKPLTWKLIKDTAEGAVNVEFRNNEDDAGVLVWAADLKQNIPLEALAVSWERQITAKKPGYLTKRLPQSRINFLNTGVKSATITFREYSGLVDGKKFRTYAGFTMNGNIAYIISGAYPEGDMDKEYIVRQSLLSFKLVKPTDSQLKSAVTGIINANIDSIKTPVAKKAGITGKIINTETNPAVFLPDDREIGRKWEVDAILADNQVKKTPEGRAYKMAYASYVPVSIEPGTNENSVDVKIYLADAEVIGWMVQGKINEKSWQKDLLAIGDGGFYSTENNKKNIWFKKYNVWVNINGQAAEAEKIMKIVDAKIK